MSEVLEYLESVFLFGFLHVLLDFQIMFCFHLIFLKNGICIFSKINAVSESFCECLYWVYQ